MARESAEFEVRQVTRDDADAVARLAERNPDTGTVRIAPQYATDPHDFYTTVASDTVGFLAESPAGEALGVGFVCFRTARVGGTVRPIAFLRGLVVKQGYRRRGIGRRLVRARIDHATRVREPDYALVASIQASNDPSRAVTASWAERFAYDRTSWAIEPRASPPETDYEVRRVRRPELPTVVDRANAAYADAELYRPYRTPDLEGWLFDRPAGDSLRQYVVARDDEDGVVAGVDVFDFHEQRWLAVESDGDLPASVPESGEIRPRRIGNLWFDTDHADAGRAVIEAVRTDPNGANRIWFQSGPEGPFAAAGATDAADGIVDITTAVEGVEPLLDCPVGDLF